jgi:hypothetical protein
MNLPAMPIFLTLVSHQRQYTSVSFFIAKPERNRKMGEPAIRNKKIHNPIKDFYYNDPGGLFSFL